MSAARTRALMFVAGAMLFIAAFATWMSLYYKSTSENFVSSWLATEALNIQEGRILETFGRGQRLLLSSNFIDGITVVDRAAPSNPVLSVGTKISLSPSDLAADHLQTHWDGLFSYRIVRPLPQNMVAVFHAYWRTAGAQVAILLLLLSAGGVLLFQFARRLTEARHQMEVELGQLAAKVAHDIRSPLTALSMAVSRLEANPEIRELIQMSSNRIRGIADDLLKKERGDSPPNQISEPVDLVVHIKNVITQKQIEVGEKFIIQTDLKPALCNWNGPLIELERILSNLLNNALEASAEGASVRVGLNQEANWISIYVKDRGRGIPPEVLNRLGSEKLSTKAGNGIGVYSAHQMLKSWGGELTIESEVGQGTTVYIKFPRVRAAH